MPNPDFCQAHLRTRSGQPSNQERPGALLPHPSRGSEPRGVRRIRAAIACSKTLPRRLRGARQPATPSRARSQGGHRIRWRQGPVHAPVLPRPQAHRALLVVREILATPPQAAHGRRPPGRHPQQLPPRSHQPACQLVRSLWSRSTQAIGAVGATSGGPHYLPGLQAIYEGAQGNADLAAHLFVVGDWACHCSRRKMGGHPPGYHSVSSTAKP